MEVVRKIEEWIDESGCVSYAGLCRNFRDDPAAMSRIYENPQHFQFYMDALLEDALYEDE